MSDNDARNQSLAELHERRKQVIRLHKRKFGVMQIVELTGLSWPAVRAAIDLYETGGMAALKPKPRGKKSGECRLLAPSQSCRPISINCSKSSIETGHISDAGASAKPRCRPSLTQSPLQRRK